MNSSILQTPQVCRYVGQLTCVVNIQSLPCRLLHAPPDVMQCPDGTMGGPMCTGVPIASFAWRINVYKSYSLGSAVLSMQLSQTQADCEVLASAHGPRLRSPIVHKVSFESRKLGIVRLELKFYTLCEFHIEFLCAWRTSACTEFWKPLPASGGPRRPSQTYSARKNHETIRLQREASHSSFTGLCGPIAVPSCSKHTIFRLIWWIACKVCFLWHEGVRSLGPSAGCRQRQRAEEEAFE